MLCCVLLLLCLLLLDLFVYCLAKKASSSVSVGCYPERLSTFMHTFIHLYTFFQDLAMFSWRETFSLHLFYASFCLAVYCLFLCMYTFYLGAHFTSIRKVYTLRCRQYCVWSKQILNDAGILLLLK